MKNDNSPPVSKERIQVLLYCTSEFILSGIMKALESYEEIEIINVEKSTIENFLQSIRSLKPAVILFTNTETLPNLREVCKAVREITKEHEKSQMILLGSIPSQEEIVGLINTGVRGYFDLNESSHQLGEAIRVVHQGEIWLPRDKMSSIMDRIVSVVGRDLKEKNP